jgi:hypothetical protein
MGREPPTPELVYKLFMDGLDTYDLGKHFMLPEWKIVRLLHAAMNAKRVANDHPDPALPTQRQPPLED